ncbi:MAG: hypothetical protein EOO20_12540 [Chryseobacterium sp.]|nr:MAG: hypothetical protein EOO20_12540 [Chryseobacterium sp.]
MKCKDSSLEVLIICYCFFKGINELAEGLGSAYLLSRTKKEAAADEAKGMIEMRSVDYAPDDKRRG